MRFCHTIVLVVAFAGCAPKKESPSPQAANPSTNTIQYAEGFRFSQLGNARLVEVTYPYQGATSGYKYLLVPRGSDVPAHDANTRVIMTPVRRIVCTSTTHIPLLDYLDETKSLVGFPTTDYISSEKMRARIDSGRVQDLGIDNALNLERLVSIQPDIVMGYTMSSDYGQFKKMEELGVPVILNAEYLEKHPLGRAEWIRFMALLFNKEAMADSVFKSIEKSYQDVKAMTGTVLSRPTVMSGILYGDSWFLPGGKNYASKIIADAGCRYIWADDESHGFLQLSLEQVYEKANDADLWIGTGNFDSMESLRAGDHRYERFKPFRDRQVYMSDARKGARGGSMFLELGYLRPDLILKDIVKIAHPELLPNHQLYFHKRLE